LIAYHLAPLNRFARLVAGSTCNTIDGAKRLLVPALEIKLLSANNVFQAEPIMSEDPTKKLIEDFAERLREFSSPVYALQKQVQELAAMVQSLDQKVDARLHDTRPIWEAVQSQLSQLNESMSDLNHKMEILHGDVLQVRTDQRKMNQRIEALEKEPA
jgi:outer membrane murein-binding lipoprotein Lpp